MICGIRVKLNSISPALQQNLTRLDELWNEGLGRYNGPFLAGDSFSAVDAFFAPVAFRVQTYNLALSESAKTYVQRLLGLDAMRDWYDVALRETWRNAVYDDAAISAGVLVKDLRN
jgi:glutathione S-transferase